MRSPPRLLRPEGAELPPALRAFHWCIASSPLPGRKRLATATRRLWWRRLPGVLAAYDNWSFAIPAGDPMYSRVFREGRYAPAESAAIETVLQSGDFVIDVGANHGWFSLLMAASVGPDGHVWAVEPGCSAREALAANMRRNPHLHITVIAAACGHGDGRADLYEFSGLPHTHSSLSSLGRSDFARVRVPMRSLDSLMEESGRRPPTLVKLDVEGSELAVLQGARRLIEDARPPMWSIEVNYETASAFGYRPSAIIDLLSAYRGYIAFRVSESGVRRECYPQAAPQGVTWLFLPENHYARIPAAWYGSAQ